jgi:hypothetical protein
MFELLNPTKAKLLDVVVLSQKNRAPDENPGAKLNFEIQLSADILAHFDGHLKGFLFTKNSGSEGAKQAALDGIPEASDMPNLTGIGMKIGKFPWHQELSGYKLVIDHGMGGKKSDLEITDGLLSNWRFTPKEGGTVIARMSFESANVTEAQFGRLAKMKSRDIEAKFLAPVDAQQSLPTGTAAAAPAQQGGDAWPFPKGNKPADKAPPQSATTEVVKTKPAAKTGSSKPAAKTPAAKAADKASAQATAATAAFTASAAGGKAH